MGTRLAIFILLIFFFNAVHAQSTGLKLKIKSNSAEAAIRQSTIRLFSLPDTLLLQTRVYDRDTIFIQIRPGLHYLLRVGLTGYRSLEKEIFFQEKGLFLEIALQQEETELGAVTVTSSRKFMQQEDDKTVIDAEPLANSSTNAYEVLEKTPGAVVDQDGNVYLNSTAPATVYINGREMKISAADIASLLKSLPAGSISKIEILRTPSARYEAANTGGIVNIVLKKGVKIGSTGSANLRVDQGVYNSVSAGVSLNNGAGKLNSFFSYQYTDRNYYEKIESRRAIGGDSVLSQQSFTRYSPVTHYLGAGLDLAINSKWTIAYDLRLTWTKNETAATSSNQLIPGINQAVISEGNTSISNDGSTIFWTNTFSSKYRLDTSGSEWTNELDYSFNENTNQQDYFNGAAAAGAPVSSGDGRLKNSGNGISLKSDFAKKFGQQYTFEGGIKFGYNYNRNNALYFVLKNGNPREPDNYQTNRFNYQENINAAYLQLSKSLAGFVLKTGLRLENSSIAGKQFIPTDTSFSLNQTALFPYIYLRRYLFKIFGYPLNGNAIFRRSITRPSYDALNPAPKFVDPYTYDVGNSFLQPQFTTNYEVNATYNDFPVFAVGVNDTKDVFSKVTYQDPATKIAFRTYDNLGHNKEIYWRLFGGLPAGHKYFMYAGVQYNYVQYRGSYQGLPLNYNRASWTLFTGHELKIRPDLRFNVNAWMYINGFRSFNELRNMGQLNVSITKMLFDKKLNLILSGNDILKTNQSCFHLQQGNLLVDGNRVQDSRRFGITIRYNFGMAKKEEKKPVFNQQPVEPLESN